MRHPEHVARLLRERSTWREPFQQRGSREHDAENWTDAAAALAGAGPLPSAAFLWCHNADTGSRRLLEHHLRGVLARFPLPESADPAELVALALDEQHCPQQQRRDDLRALVLGLPAKVWQTRYRTPHARLLAEIDSLVGDAWRVARDRLDDAA